ncbi:MAG: hypothetical protein ACM3KR_00210 [Deltaproteobacteria bacterium]
MGETIKILHEKNINSRGIFPRRLVTECCENFHIHYRWLRIEMNKAEFEKVLSVFNKSEKRYQELGKPESCYHEELSKEVMPNYIDRKIKFELCRNLYKHTSNEGGKDSEFFSDRTYIHIHWDNLRIEISRNEFEDLYLAFMEAKRHLEDFPIHLSELFKKIDELEYLVIRNYQGLPDKIQVGEHSDLDILIREKDKQKLISLLKLEKMHPEDNNRVQYTMNIIDDNGSINFIYIDVRTEKDNYFPKKLSNELLRGRCKNENGFYIPQKCHYVIALLYHAVYHKGIIRDDYLKEIYENTEEFILKDLIKTKDIVILAKYLRNKGIKFIRPNDYSTYDINSVKNIVLKISVYNKFISLIKARLGFIKKIPQLNSFLKIIYEITLKIFYKFVIRK